MRLFPFRRKKAPLTAGEAFIQREFAEAIAFAAQEWRGFEAYCRHVDPTFNEHQTLARRVNAFMAGPVTASLEERFPSIEAVGRDADEKTGAEGHKELMLRMIVMEGVIASGTNSREEVRALAAE